MLGIFKSIFGRNPDDLSPEETAARKRLQKLRDRKIAPHSEGDEAASSFRDLVQTKTHEPGTSPFAVWTGLEGKAHSVGLTNNSMVRPFKGGAFGFSEDPLHDDIDQFNRENFSESSEKKKLQFDLGRIALANLLSRHGQIVRNLDPEPGAGSSGQFDVVKDTKLVSDWYSNESLFSNTGLFCEYSDTVTLPARQAPEVNERAKCFGPPIDLNKLEKPKEVHREPAVAEEDDFDFVDEVLFHIDNAESLFDDEPVSNIVEEATLPANTEVVAAGAQVSEPALRAQDLIQAVEAARAVEAVEAVEAVQPAEAAQEPPAVQTDTQYEDVAEYHDSFAEVRSEVVSAVIPDSTCVTLVTALSTEDNEPEPVKNAKPSKNLRMAIQPNLANPAKSSSTKSSQQHLAAAQPQDEPVRSKESSKIKPVAKAKTKELTRIEDPTSQPRTREEKRNLLLSDLCDSMEIKQFSHPYDKFSESSLKLIAQNPKTPTGALAWLAAHRNPHIRAAVAKNPITPIETFWVLARDHESSIRYSIAENLYMSPEILRELSRDRNPLIATTAQNALHSVRESLMNALPPSSLYSKKSGSTGQSMPAAKAASPGVVAAGSIETDAEQQGDEEFLLMIARKSTTPGRRLKELANHSHSAIRAAVAENANTPVDVLWLMARDSDPTVKIRLSANTNLPEEILDILKEDRDSFVVKAAVKVQSMLAGLRYSGEASGNEVRHILTWP